MKRLILICIAFFLCAAAGFAKNDNYIYDYWNYIEHSPDAYRVSSVLYGSSLGLDTMLKNPAGLYCIDQRVFIVDSGNNRIIELLYNENKTLSFVRVIDRFYTDDPDMITTFAGPSDIFVNKDGTIFIADTNNGRVLKLDENLNLLLTFVEPDDPTYEKGKSFLPEKVIADDKGRPYVLAKNVNKGFIKYEYDGKFTGFYGASKVVFNWSDYVWKLFSTRKQREQMESFVPTEYSNAYIDSEGFVFATVKTFQEWDLLSDKAKPIRRLNALGEDILVKNATVPPIGDLNWGNAAGIRGASKFADITVLDNEVYIAIDENRGRLFGYNNQGYLLFAFGGKGNIEGYFRTPTAVEHCGRDLFILDAQSCALTVYTPTEFGNLIYDATEQYACGEYDEAAVTWQKVLDLNGNYDLAYIGLGKALVRQKRYKEAMTYFKLKHDRKDYSKAFMYYRKEVVEKNVGYVVFIAAALLVVCFAIKRISKIKKELEAE